MNFYSNFLKRIFDFLFAVLFLIISLPLVLIISLLQLKYYGFSILYLQERNGLNAKVFKIIKFRTMIDLADSSGKQLPDKKRSTELGNLLRRFSLDEIPNVLNIVLGHMSFVGPRPLPVTYLKHMSARQRKRYAVRPGITGLAQINGGNDLSHKNRINFDLKYISKISASGDIAIIIRTFFYVLRQEGKNHLGDQSIDSYIPNFDN